MPFLKLFLTLIWLSTVNCEPSCPTPYVGDDYKESLEDKLCTLQSFLVISQTAAKCFQELPTASEKLSITTQNILENPETFVPDDIQNIMNSTPILKYLDGLRYYEKLPEVPNAKTTARGTDPLCCILSFIACLAGLCDTPDIVELPPQTGGPQFGSPEEIGDINMPGLPPQLTPEQVEQNEAMANYESWESYYVNTPQLDDNCYYCTLAGLNRTTVDGMMNHLETLQTNGGTNLGEILDLFKSAGYSEVALKRFAEHAALLNFLRSVVRFGEIRLFGLAYYPAGWGGAGHVVVLKVWNTLVGGLGTRIIDFQRDPGDPERFQSDVLPFGESYLINIQRRPGDIFHPDFIPDGSFTGGGGGSTPPTIPPLPPGLWFDFTHAASGGAATLLPFIVLWEHETNSTDSAIPPPEGGNDFVRNPDAENLQSSVVNYNDTFGFTAAASAPAITCRKRIIGYYTSWGDSYFTVFHAQRLTHVVFAFFEMRPDFTLADLQPKAKQRLEYLFRIKGYFPHLKVMFAIGGWDNSQYFSSMAKTEGGRGVFIRSVLGMVRTWGFHGVDIDWEHPVTGGANDGVAEDKGHYVQLMRELRAAGGTELLISFAGAAGKWTLDPGYDLPNLLRYANWVNVMTYDYYGAWASEWGAFTGPPAPLFYAVPDKWSGMLNADWALKYYTCRIGDPSKVVMGVPLYGRYWENVGDPIQSPMQIWRIAVSMGGVVGGSDPFSTIKTGYLQDSSYSQGYDEGTQTPYFWNQAGRKFVGYEDQKSLLAKVDYAVKNNLGGMMIWAVDFDDEKLSLLTTVSGANLCTGSYRVNVILIKLLSSESFL